MTLDELISKLQKIRETSIGNEPINLILRDTEDGENFWSRLDYSNPIYRDEDNCIVIDLTNCSAIMERGLYDY